MRTAEPERVRIKRSCDRWYQVKQPRQPDQTCRLQKPEAHSQRKTTTRFIRNDVIAYAVTRARGTQLENWTWHEPAKFSMDSCTSLPRSKFDVTRARTGPGQFCMRQFRRSTCHCHEPGQTVYEWVRVSPFKLAIEFESETNQDSTASVRTQKRYFFFKKKTRRRTQKHKRRWCHGGNLQAALSHCSQRLVMATPHGTTHKKSESSGLIDVMKIVACV